MDPNTCLSPVQPLERHTSQVGMHLEATSGRNQRKVQELQAMSLGLSYQRLLFP